MRIDGVGIAAVLMAGVVSVASVAGVMARPGAETVSKDRYKPLQGFSYVIGSKRAVGFFQAAEGNCKLTLMIAEAVGDDAVPPSAARLILSMMPGQRAELGSEEREGIEVTCGSAAAAITIGQLAAKPM